MPKKVMIATGGTGGHIYPAVALAQRIVDEWHDAEVLFVGGALDTNKYFDRNAFPWKSVSCGTFFGKAPIALLKSCFRIGNGVRQSCQIIKKFKPDIIVGFGSYYCFPPLVAAKIMSVPFLLHEANTIPGKVNKVLSRWASVTGVHFPKTSTYLKGTCVEVGMPLRRGFKKDLASRSNSRKYFGLKNDGFTLLVFGGSQGSRIINEAVMAALVQIKPAQSIQVIHIGGDPDESEKLRLQYKHLNIEACVKAYEENMQHAWQAADAVVCRSGAGAVAELLEFEVPAILIPFARAADDHQNHNADFIVDTVRGGLKVQENGIASGGMLIALKELLKDDGATLAAMREAMREYKRGSRTRDMFSLISDNICNE